MCVAHTEDAVPDEEGCFTFFTDCLWVASSSAAGPSACASADHVGAALWRKLSRLIDDRFPTTDKVKVTKVKAHTSVSDREGSQDLLWRRAGNEVADAGATKAGAALHPGDAGILACMADSDRVIFELAQYMGNAAAYRWRLYYK